MGFGFNVFLCRVVCEPGVQVPQMQADAGAYGRGIPLRVAGRQQHVGPDLLGLALELGIVGIPWDILDPDSIGDPGHDIEQPGLTGIKIALMDQAGRPLRVQDQAEYLLSHNGCGGIRIKYQPCITSEQLTVLSISWRPGRNLRADVFGKTQSRWLHRFDQGIQCPKLVGGFDDFRQLLGVSSHAVGIPDTTDPFGYSVQLVSVPQVQRHQDFFQHGQRSVRPDGGNAEATQRPGANRHFQVEGIHGICTVIPEVSRWMGAAGRTGIRIGNELPALCDVVIDDGFQRLFLIGPIREVGVAVFDRDDIPLADSYVVGAIQGDTVVVRHFGERRRVVHDRRAVVDGSGKIVLDAQRVPDLMGRELTDSCQRHVQHGIAVGRHGYRVVWIQETFSQQIILADAQ